MATVEEITETTTTEEPKVDHGSDSDDVPEVGAKTTHAQGGK